MASAVTDIPPFDRMFLTGIWIETLLYGMNCIIFTGALYVLFRRRKTRTPPRFLIAVSCWLFLLSTAHVGTSLHQLIGAFIKSPPGEASIYFVNPANPEYVTKLVLYTTNIFTQDLVLIWRLWVLYGRNWKIVAVPLIVEAAHIAAGYICCAQAARGTTFSDKLTHTATLVTWIVDLIVNVGVTSLIAYRLYSAGHSVSGISLFKKNKNKYTSTILTIVESGFILASAIVVMVGLFLSNNNATVAAVDVVTQIATLTPLLIIVRVGFGITHGEPATTILSSKTASAPGHSSSKLDRSGVHITTSEHYELSPSLPEVKGSLV